MRLKIVYFIALCEAEFFRIYVIVFVSNYGDQHLIFINNIKKGNYEKKEAICLICFLFFDYLKL